MTTLLESIVDSDNGSRKDPKFPRAPEDWTEATGRAIAKQESLALNADHWNTIRALQEYYANHQDRPLNVHELHDALDEKFHAKGGLRYLYEIFPGGPVAQGCRVAGLKAPVGAVDRSFGSVE